MRRFAYDQRPARVVFGPGTFDNLSAEADKLGARKVIVLSTRGRHSLADDAARRLGPCVAGTFCGAEMHVPVETARAALDQARRSGADAVVAIGGGSTIGLAKAVALETGLPILAIPTTYSGSEMTPIYGLTESGRKRTGRDSRVLPKSVIYDPLLTVSLPARITGTSGMNAIAHCVEALYSATANPLTSLMAQEGIRALAESLVACVQNPEDVESRGEALYGAWLAGAVLGSVGMGLHHKLCHVLGGSFALPHSETHSVVLPHAAACNASAAPEAMSAVANAMKLTRSGQVPGALYDLAVALGAPMSLGEIGFRESDLDRAAELATESPYPNPRSVSRAEVYALLERALHGVRPAEIA